MTEKIVWAFLTTLGAGVIWLLRAFLLARPRLEVRYERRDGQSSMGSSSDTLKVRWGYRVTIANISKYDALEVKVLSATTPELTASPTDHIKALEQLPLELNLVKELKKAEVVEAQHDFHGRLEPTELRDVSVLLRYKSEHGLVFYSLYNRRDGSDITTYSVRMPRQPPNNKMQRTSHG